VRGHGLHYLLGLKQVQPTLYAEANRLLRYRRKPVADTVDVVGATTVTRQLFISDEMAQFGSWPHLQTVLRVQSLTHHNTSGELLCRRDRYFVCSLPIDAMTPQQWLLAVRRHWAVENDCHNIWPQDPARG